GKAPLPRSVDDSRHPLSAPAELRDARLRPRPDGRTHRALRDQRAGRGAGGQGLRLAEAGDRMSAAATRPTVDEKEAYLAAFRQLQESDQAAVPPWLARIRNAAVERFRRSRFPTTHDEDWKY